MLFEYAVEPQAIGSSWQNFRYLIEKFGFDRGRLIAQFPKGWTKLVHDASAGMKNVERLRLVEALNQAKKSKLIRSGRPYDPAIGTWLDNATAQQAAAPFHAIIALENPTARNDVLLVDDADEAHPLMACAHAWEVQRTGGALASAMAPMLRAARTVLFVDPFFDIRRPHYCETLKASLDLIAAAGGAPPRCEIHFRDHDARPPAELIERNAHRWLKDVLPGGFSVSLFAWKQKVGGEDLHARDLFTDVGALNVEAGFEALGAHQSVRLSLLSDALAAQGLAKFARTGTAYDLVQPILKINADGSVEREP
ncbi:hypothetical protein EJV44_17270 [Ancylobacter aquaticus]|nr:hypothetical protein EJV44_17270 [Ancylobacter aquaticus]